MKLSGLHILLTYKCVYECDDCFVWGSPRQSGVLAIAQIEQILNQAKDASVDWIYFEDGRRDGLSHWHRLERVLGDTMFITVTGRKTGRKYTTPVGYYQEGDTLWVISSRNRTWWRNATGGAQVDLYVRGRDITAFAESILDEEAVAARIGDYLRRVPLSARPLGARCRWCSESR